MSVFFTLIYRLLGLYSWVIIAHCVLSFMPQFNNRFTQAIHQLCEPVLQPVRNFLQGRLRMGYMDFSPVVVILAISLLQTLVARLI